MKRLDLYLGSSILSATLLAWLVIAALEGAFIFLGQLDDIGHGGYGLVQAVEYSLLVLPARAYQSFSMAVLLGALLGLGRLAAHNELDAFRLAGYPEVRLVDSVLLTGLLLTLVVFLLGESLAPGFRENGLRLRTMAMYDKVQLQDGHGFWVRSGNRFIQVESTTVDGQLANLQVFEPTDDARLKVAMTIARAEFAKGIWHLQDIRASRFTPQRAVASLMESADWTHLMDPRLASLLRRDPRGLSLQELSRYMVYLKGNGADISVYRLSWWQRLAMPLSVLAMLLLSLGFVLGPFGHYGTGRRVLTGIFIGLAFKLLNDITAHAGLVYGVPPYVAAFFPSLVVFLPALYLLYRTRRGRV